MIGGKRTHTHTPSETHTGAVVELCTPEVHVATFLILPSCVNLTLYGVAMVTCQIQPVPEANEES